MPDIDFGDGSWEDARVTIQNNIVEIVALVKGNGREGMKTMLETFITEYRTDRATSKTFQDKRDQEIKDAISAREKKHEDEIAIAQLAVSKKSVLWTIVQTLVAMAAVAVSVMAIAATVYLAKHSSIEPHQLFLGKLPSLAAQHHQNAGGGEVHY